jgi:hypothetical protein
MSRFWDWLAVSYVISSRKGQVLRRFPTLSQEKAESFAYSMRQLSLKARSVVRDMDPPVRGHRNLTP